MKFPCPSCRKLIEVPDSLAGQKSECPYCGASGTPPPVKARPAEPGKPMSQTDQAFWGIAIVIIGILFLWLLFTSIAAMNPPPMSH